MKQIYIRTVLIFLIYAVLLSACGTDPKTGQPVKADLKEFLAAALGWGSYEEMALLGAEGPLLISITDEVDPNQVLVAFPETFAMGIVGDRFLDSMAQSGAGNVIGEGEAYAARLQSSLYAIQKAFSSHPAARMFIDPTERYVVTFFPSAGNAWHMGSVDLTTRSMFTLCRQLQNCGSFINYKSASELTQVMKDNGWKAIAADQIPQSIRTYFTQRMGWVGKAWFMRLKGVTASPLFVPTGTFLVPDSIFLPDGYDFGASPQQ